MNSIFPKFALGLIAILSFTFATCDDCNNDEITDYSPIIFRIQVVDKQGATRLDTLAPNYIGILPTLTYKGETYSCSAQKHHLPLNSSALRKPKYYLPSFWGFRNLVSPNDGSRYLYFGELDGANDYNDDLILNWADGSQDIIHYKRKVTCSGIKEECTLNGKKTNRSITIVR